MQPSSSSSSSFNFNFSSKPSFNPNHFTQEQKQEMADCICSCSYAQMEREMDWLISATTTVLNVSPYAKKGNKVVDYFTLVYRLETRGKYGINFYDFVENIDHFKQKKFIQTMFRHYSQQKRTKEKPVWKLYKEIYNVCINAIHVMKPINCIELIRPMTQRLAEPVSMLNFCLGWGGTAVAAAALRLEKHIGIEINPRLTPAYAQMNDFLRQKSPTELQCICQDALTVDYSALDYNLVFTSPPYYFIERYEHNVAYASKQEMNALFYAPLFSRVFAGLRPHGIFMINVCQEVYDQVLCPLLHSADEIVPLKHSKRQSNHQERVYIWRKSGTTIKSEMNDKDKEKDTTNTTNTKDQEKEKKLEETSENTDKK